PKFEGLLNEIYAPSRITVNFDFENAMTDLMGDEQAKRCSQAMQKVSLTDKLPDECRISEIFAAPAPVPFVSYKDKSLKLIGLIVIVDKNGVQLDTDGSPGGEVHDPKQKGQTIAALPPGSYLIFMTDPNAGIYFPGEALYLLSDDQKSEYYIPG